MKYRADIAIDGENTETYLDAVGHELPDGPARLIDANDAYTDAYHEASDRIVTKYLRVGKSEAETGRSRCCCHGDRRLST